MLNRIATALRIVVIVILLILILLPILLGLMILLWVIDLPQKVGRRLDFEKGIRRVLYRAINPDEMRRFRNDMLHIVESEIEITDDPDRWGLLREIDKSQSEIERRLKNGEFAFSFIGGIIAIGIGNLLGIVLGGLILTIVGLLFSLLVSIRIVVTDTLCYQSTNHQEDSIRRLVLLNAWNRGPIFGSGAIGVAILSAITSINGVEYRIGRQVLETYAETKYSGENKWQAE